MAKVKPLTGKFGDFSGIVLKAAARGDHAAVREYLKVNPAWLNQEGPHGRTLLWEAVYKGRTSLVAELIELGADVNPLGSYYTPMLVELSALEVARSSGRTELVELLIKHGAKDDIYAASHRGDLEAINDFLSADPGFANEPSRVLAEPHQWMGYHAVHYAVAGKQIGSMRLLVGAGAEVDEHMALLLHWAQGDREMTRYLKQFKSAKAANPSGSRRGKKSEKPNHNVPAIDRPDWMGFPPLVEACRGNHNAPDDPDRVQKILDKGANVNITDNKQKTPLHRSCQAGHLKITKLLLDHGADIDAVDETNSTPIFDAAHHGRSAVVELLVKNGASLTHTDKRGETPLFAAARGARPKTFTLLLELGAELAVTNSRGKSIAEVVKSARAQTANRKAILKLL